MRLGKWEREGFNREPREPCERARRRHTGGGESRRALTRINTKLVNGTKADFITKIFIMRFFRLSGARLMRLADRMQQKQTKETNWGGNVLTTNHANYAKTFC